MTTYYNYLGQAMPVSGPPSTFVVDNGGPDGAAQNDQTLNAGDGNVSVDTNGGVYDTLIGGNGDDNFYVANITDIVQVDSSLTGVKSITSWAGGYTLPDNVQNLTFYGAGNWGAGNTSANLIVMGGNDHATLDGGGGDDVLVGGDGENDFQFEVGLGGGPSHDVFYNFHPDQDTVRISGASFTTFAQLQQAMTEVTGPDGQTDTVLTIDANDSITFRDTTIAQLQPRDFLMPLDTSQLGALTFDDEFTSLNLYNSSTGTGLWQDNFGSDPTKVDDYTITSNDEKELYTAPGFVGQQGHDLSAYNPFTIDNGGGLSITAGRFSAFDAQYTWGQAYYSGMLNTRGVFMQQYGYFDMKAELPTALGSWPAFWLSQDPYKPGVEADLLEHLAMYPDTAMSRVDDGGTVVGHTTYFPPLTGFHDYGMLWTPTTTTFYIDNLAVLQVATPASWDQPMYMILDLALGGWGGPISDSSLPAQMQVQYVHIYGLADSPVDVSEGYATYTAAAGVNSVTLLGSSQTVNANDAGDTLTSNDNGGNHLIGGAGNDTIVLGGGGDVATGGGGDDVFSFNAAPPVGGTITDFDASDQLDLSGVLTSLNYTGSNAIADGVLKFADDGSGDAQVWAMDNGSWILVATLDSVPVASLVLSGGTVAETTAQSGGGTAVTTNASSYTAPSGVTDITLAGSQQTVTGNNAGDTFHSNSSGNHLIGGIGVDTFDLGSGGDVATGGGGGDSFVIDALPSSGATITDFGADDSIDLSGLLNGLNYSGSNPVADGVVKFTDDGSGDAQVWASHAGQWSLVTTLDAVIAHQLTIANGLVTEGGLPEAVPSDLFGAGSSDILFQNDGQLAEWSLSGMTVSGQFLSTSAQGWVAQDTGDFNGDGKSGDLLFRNPTTGQVAVWEMDGTQIESAGMLPTTATNWQVEGTGDFNGDGKSDIVWRDSSSGSVAVWEMNGTTIQSSAMVTSVSSDWHMVGSADFNGDGMADMLWQNASSGQVAIWEMNGTAVQSAGFAATAPSGWNVVGSGDFDGDGAADILLRDQSTGQVAIWEMNGSAIKSASMITSVGSDWQVAGTGDYNGDGKTDILWHDAASGQVAVWDMNGFSIASSGIVGQVDNSWSILNHHYDWI